MKETEENRTNTETTGAATPPPAKEPYVAPTIEVIEVRTERGYAASPASGSNWGNGGRW